MKNKQKNDISHSLVQSEIETPLGTMIAVADERSLYLLEFVESKNKEKTVKQLQRQTNSTIIHASNHIITSIAQELKAYFDGTLTTFKTPYEWSGSSFQNQTWQALSQIPYGKTCSYADIAAHIDKPTAFRAVANANGRNQLAIIIPCHRVIKANGDLCGYNAGIERKQWLLDHEKRNNTV